MTDSLYQDRINAATQFMEARWNEPIQLGDIADAAAISPFHFHRIFKAITGQRVKEFLTRIRLEKAAHQLKYSADDVSAIALATGYQNHETFSRAFKDYFGQTPSAYRATIREQTATRQQYLRELKIDEQLGIEDPVIKEIAPLHVAYLRHTGSYDHVAKTWQRLMLWSITHFHFRLNAVTLGIIHDDPYLTESDHIRFDACLVVNKPFKEKSEVAYKTVAGGKYAVFTFKGGYDKMYAVYDYIYNVCVFKHKFQLDHRPAFEWYVKSPPFYKPEQFITDFYIPIG